MIVSLSLPWPSAALSPNGREHWAAKSRAAKKHRAWARLAALAAGLRPGAPWARITVTWHPPTRTRRDLDNLIGRFKCYQDGIADALGADDASFRVEHAIGELRKPAGAVVAQVEIKDIICLEV